MKRYMITYEIQYTVEANSKDEAKKESRRRIESYLDTPDDLRTLLQVVVMNTDPTIEEIKEVSKCH